MKKTLLPVLSLVALFAVGCAPRKSAVAVSWDLTFAGRSVGCGQSAGNIEAVGVYAVDASGNETQLAEFPCYSGHGTFELDPGTYSLSLSALECANVFGLPVCASDGDTTLGRVKIAKREEDLGYFEIQLRDVE